MENDENIKKIISQLDPNSRLGSHQEALLFKNNLNRFYFKDDKIYCLDQADKGYNEQNKDYLINRLKLFFKKRPKIFLFLFYLLGAVFVGKSAKNAIKEIGAKKLILNLGSGMRNIRDDIINIDFYPFKNVDIVADIVDLPFADNSVDAVINDFVLEHVPEPGRIVEEIYRILKPDGYLYLSIPFVASFHSSPNDFYRWSKSGLDQLLKNFNKIESGIRCGPTSALVYVLSEWLATIFSLGQQKIQQIFFLVFMLFLAPLKIIDWLISGFPTSENIAYGFYFIGKKK